MMSKVYTVRSNAKKHIIKQLENCTIKKTNNGTLYNHNKMVKMQKTIKSKLNDIYCN
jgi:hypothetical protein